MPDLLDKVTRSRLEADRERLKKEWEAAVESGLPQTKLDAIWAKYNNILVLLRADERYVYQR